MTSKAKQITMKNLQANATNLNAALASDMIQTKYAGTNTKPIGGSISNNLNAAFGT